MASSSEAEKPSTRRMYGREEILAMFTSALPIPGDLRDKMIFCLQELPPISFLPITEAELAVMLKGVKGEQVVISSQPQEARMVSRVDQRGRGRGRTVATVRNSKANDGRSEMSESVGSVEGERSRREKSAENSEGLYSGSSVAPSKVGAMEKGIVGVKKDPKNPMFLVSSGDGCPSRDSAEVSHYAPEASSVKPRKRRGEGSNSRRSSPQKPVAKKLKSGNDDPTHLVVSVDGTAPGTTDHNPVMTLEALRDWGSRMPTLVLLKIFKCIEEAEGPVPTLCRASIVCHRWNEIIQESILWRKVDLSLSSIVKEERILEIVFFSKNMSRLMEVNLSNWQNLTNSGVQMLADNCPQLTCVRLSGTGVNSAGVSYLVDKCPDLNSFDLSSMKTDAPHGKALQHLLESRGNRVRSLNLSSNALKNFNNTMQLISSACTQLKVLDLSSVQFTSEVTLEIEKMQRCFSHLQILRLSNAPFRISYTSPNEQFTSPGFPHLQELDLGVTSSGDGISSDTFNYAMKRILKTSFELKSLNIRGSTSVTCESLQSLPVTELQRLFISSSSAAKYEGIEIIMTKWQHSLVMLDLSWNLYPGMSLDMAMKKLSSDPTKSKLQHLDLRGTQISCARVQSILEGCPRLNCLLLDSCSGLPRGMKKEYSDLNLVQLRLDIASLVALAEKDEAATTRDLCLLP